MLRSSFCSLYEHTEKELTELGECPFDQVGALCRYWGRAEHACTCAHSFDAQRTLLRLCVIASTTCMRKGASGLEPISVLPMYESEMTALTHQSAEVPLQQLLPLVQPRPGPTGSLQAPFLLSAAQYTIIMLCLTVLPHHIVHH